MELLLNLIWLALSMGAFVIFLRRRPRAGRDWQPHRRALLALACTLLLLFPVVSASDDLHPTQALLEDATRRIQQFASPLQLAHSGSVIPLWPMLPALALALGFALATWQPWRPQELPTAARRGYSRALGGRAPPLFSN